MEQFPVGILPCPGWLRLAPDGEKPPFALSVVSVANGVEALSFDSGPIFFKDGTYAQDERMNSFVL